MRLLETLERILGDGRIVRLEVSPVAAYASVLRPGRGSRAFPQVSYASVKRLRRVLAQASYNGAGGAR